MPMDFRRARALILVKSIIIDLYYVVTGGVEHTVKGFSTVAENKLEMPRQTAKVQAKRVIWKTLKLN